MLAQRLGAGEGDLPVSDKIECCFIGEGPEGVSCDKEAEWQIVSGPRDSDVTYGCTAHVGYLLSDALEQRVYPIHPLDSQLPETAEC